jgi:penicillin-binding protein 2
MHRLLALRIVLVVVVALLISRLYQLQLIESDEQHTNNSIEVNTVRYVPVLPRRGEILAHDGKTLLAESVPTFNIAVMPSRLPSQRTEPERRALVLGRLAQISHLTSTLTISPATALAQMPPLRRELVNLFGEDIAPPTPTDQAVVHDNQHNTEPVAEPVMYNPPDTPPTTTPLTFTVPPSNTLDVLEIVHHYPDLLTLHNPIEQQIEWGTTRYYQLAIIKENISPKLALAVRENATYLPGVEVVKQYQRRYPQSKEIPSLSHLLGYIGRINECELATENPASSWLDSLLDILGHATNCGILSKKLETHLSGTPPYLHNDRIGKDGLEASYESELRGTMGLESLVVDAFDRPVGNNRVVRHVRDGGDLVLTIDTDFQIQTETILRRWIDEAERRRQNADEYHKRDYPPITNGVAIVMNVTSGDVLAMVSLPAYDNNVWVDPTRTDELRDLLHPSDPEKREELERLSPLTNRAIAGQYPPGSSFKQFVGSVALEQGIISPDTRLRDPGKIVLQERGGHTFILPNSSPRDNGNITVSDALKVSSNVFFASIAGGNEEAVNLGDWDLRIRGLTISGLSKGLNQFRFGHTTTITLPGEAAGRVPDPVWKSHILREPWTTGDTYNTAIGQGYLEVTPLQLITAAASVANGGTLYRPQLVSKILDSSGNVIHEQPPEILSQIPIDPNYLAVIREGMRRSVTEGINIAARDACSGLSIAGKTGTAEFGPIIIKPGGAATRRSHSWFVGFAPYDKPETIVLVLIEGSGDMGDGSATLAVPAVTQILQAHFQVDPTHPRAGFCPALPH